MQHVFQIQYQLMSKENPITNDMRIMFVLAGDVIEAIDKLKELYGRRKTATSARGEGLPCGESRISIKEANLMCDVALM